MDEGKFAADFINANITKIFDYAKSAYGKLDETLKIKLKTAYTDYLHRTREKYSKSKSFFIRSQPIDLYEYYVPTGIACDSIKISKPDIENCLKISNKIVISGTGGSGKTVLMKHFFLNCIDTNSYTPILIELRDINQEETNLRKFIRDTLDDYGFVTSGDFIEKAMKAGHFCFFLDGFDEVSHAHRKKLISQIKSLGNKYKKCPIIISTRPDDTLNGIDEFVIFTVLPLDLNSATSLISKLPYDNEVKEKFTHDLRNGLFFQHSSFLSNPLLLSIMLLTYGENARIPTKLSLFYNQAYEALFQRHDANKGGFSRSRLTDLDIQDFSKVFSLFCLQTYDKRLFKMSRSECLNFIDKSREKLDKNFNSENYLTDLLSAACLMIEDGLEVAFSHRSFQEYFVAVYISSASPEVQKNLINRYLKNIRSDNVLNLILEINPELVERELIIPQLEGLFESLNVKNKVGITHAAKFFTSTYSKILVEPDELRAEYKQPIPGYEAIVKMIILHTDSYSFPPDEYFDKQIKDIYATYGNGEDIIVYSTKSMTHKTPILNDLLSSEGNFSRNYLQAAFNSYKQLKNKHQNLSESIDKLLE